MRKKLLGLMISLALSFMAVMPAWASMMYNGNVVQFRQETGDYGEVLIPLRTIADTLNCSLSWDSTTQTARISNATTNIIFLIGNKYPSKNGSSTFYITTAPKIIDNVIYVPASTVLKELGSVSAEKNGVVIAADAPHYKQIPYKKGYINAVCNYGNEIVDGKYDVVDKNGSLCGYAYYENGTQTKITQAMVATPKTYYDDYVDSTKSLYDKMQNDIDYYNGLANDLRNKTDFVNNQNNNNNNKNQKATSDKYTELLLQINKDKNIYGKDLPDSIIIGYRAKYGDAITDAALNNN